MSVLVLILLIAAVALFILSAIASVARGWMLSIGLACFAGAFLAPLLFNRLG